MRSCIELHAIEAIRSLNECLHAPAPGDGCIESLIRIQAMCHKLTQLQTQLNDHKLTLEAVISRPRSLPFELSFADAQTQALQKALGEKCIKYFYDLHQAFAHVRVQFRQHATSHLLHISEQYQPLAKVNELLHHVLGGELTEKDIAIILMHCQESNAMVDMRRFLAFLDAVSPPRESCIRCFFYLVWPSALASSTATSASVNQENLRVFKLVALLKENFNNKRCSSSEFTVTMTWLQSFKEPTLTLVQWIEHYRVQSDEFKDDVEFILYLDRIWNVLAKDNTSWSKETQVFTALIQSHHEALHAQKQWEQCTSVLSQVEMSQNQVQSKLDALQLEAQSIQRGVIKGTVLGNKPEIVKSVFQTLECLESLQITPVLSSPPDVFSCKRLSTLDVSDIGLHQIPISMAKLPLLKAFRASNNRLTKSSFPTEVELWPLIETIDMSSNQFSVLPEIFGQWKCLLHCDLSKNQLLTLNEQVVGQWKALRTLALHKNRLVSLPESIQQCQNLSKLSCQYNSLTTLPQGISHLHKLQELTLDHNKVTWTIVPSLKGLHCLAQCTLGHNQIRTIPIELHYESLKALRTCSLGHNLLRDVSQVEWSCLVACTEVDLSHNRLVNLPASLFQMAHLEHLNVQSNALTSLPTEIACCQQLLSLHAHRNQIAMLPEELAKITTLKHVDFSHNRIASLPLTWKDFLLHRQPDKSIVLEMLKLDDNPLMSPLKEIVAKGSYKSPATQQLTMTLIKLVDYLQKSTTKRSKVELMTFQSLHKNDKKQYDLKVRKGQAKLATEYLDWAFRDIDRSSGSDVEIQSFRRVLNALGCPWTKVEWTRIMTEFEGTSSLSINFDSFLDAVENVHQPSSLNLSFVEQLLHYLQDTADAIELKPAKPAQPSPPPFTPPITKPSVPPSTAVETSSKPKPTKNEMRLREQVRRQRERMAILQQQLQDKWHVEQTHHATEQSNNRRQLEVICVGATTLGTLLVPWESDWTVMDLKLFVEQKYDIPKLQQMYIGVASENRRRLDNADRLSYLMSEYQSLQLVVGAAVSAIFTPSVKQ